MSPYMAHNTCHFLDSAYMYVCHIWHTYIYVSIYGTHSYMSPYMAHIHICLHIWHTTCATLLILHICTCAIYVNIYRAVSPSTRHVYTRLRSMSPYIHMKCMRAIYGTHTYMSPYLAHHMRHPLDYAYMFVCHICRYVQSPLALDTSCVYMYVCHVCRHI